MKMSDVRVGMRLRSTIGTPEEVTVTKITERGFEYSLDEEKSFIPRWGMRFAKDGHEHFGVNGEAYYELVAQATAPSQDTPAADTAQAPAGSSAVTRSPNPVASSEGDGE